ncbi:hypothetical protein D6D04_10042 [Aureobasidium pullulans]|nr:hypothetical protein D6D04_10042 [Aureobasidium pullulans]
MPESIPNIPESEILDKSKASTLAKTIVCLQALWFCIQCIARLSQGASISFLELNVLGHCLCAFATYAIWWKNPTDVSQPTSLSVSDGLREYADVVYLFSGRPGALPTFPTVPGMWSSTAPSVEMPPWYMSPRHESRPGIAFDVSHDQQSFEDITTKVKFGDLLRSAMFTAEHCFVKVHEGIPHYLLSLQLYGKTWITYMLPIPDLERQTAVEQSHDASRVIFDLEPAMAELRNWSLSRYSVTSAVEFKERLSSITLSVVALVYGGLHLFAWNAPFHTRIEELLWKISGIVVASIGPVLIPTWRGFIYVMNRCFYRHYRTRKELLRPIIRVFYLLLGSYLLLYLFARVYLVVECFIEVAYLSDSAFTTPVFTRYIPHFG